MAEKLYKIPVNEAFEEDSECPVCYMYSKLEKDALQFMLGPSYMEEDLRTDTNENGFCKMHMKMLLSEKNRLGLALILKTHLDKQISDAVRLSKAEVKPAGLFKKGTEAPISVWAKSQTGKCSVCNRIGFTFSHYIDTVIRLYESDSEFRKKYIGCKGFCQEHTGLLIEKAREVLSQKELNDFIELTVKLYTDNLKRVSDDLEWFAVKYDYRYKDAPWKNAKDSIERAVIKTNGIMEIK